MQMRAKNVRAKSPDNLFQKIPLNKLLQKFPQKNRVGSRDFEILSRLHGKL